MKMKVYLWLSVLLYSFKSIRISTVALAATILITGCEGMPGQFEEGMRVITGKGGTKEKVDTFPDIKEQAAEIAKTSHKPSWQKVFHADAADIFELIPGNRILLGEVQVSTALAEPQYGDLSLYDMKTGSKLWTVKRRDLEWGRYDLLAAKPAIILQGSSPKGGYYTALDVQTGQTLWEHETKPAERGIYDGASNRIYLLDVGTQKSVLLALNADNGEVVWQQTLSGVSEGASINLIPHKKSLYVLAGKVYKISSTSGAIEWQKPIADYFDNLKELKLRVTSQGVLLWDRRRMSLLGSDNGSINWGPVYASPPTEEFEGIKTLSVPEQSGKIFLSTTEEHVYSFDLRTGKKIWRYKLLKKKDGMDVTSPFLLAAGKLYFTTWKSFTVLDVSNGERVARTEFSWFESGLKSNLMPDILMELGDKIIMVREEGVIYAFSKKTNEVLWSESAKTNYFLYFSSDQINDDLRKVLPEKVWYEKKSQETAAWWSAWTSSVDYQWSGYHYQGSAGSPQLSSFGASMVLFQSMLGLSEMIETGLKGAAAEGLAERLNMELINAGKNHQRSIQRGYVIRPFDSRAGTLVMIVNLDTGKRFDLFYSPSNLGMRYIDMRLPSFIIDPSGKSLYTIEIGINPQYYEKYVKFKYGMPYPSILRYKLADLDFAGKP